MSESRRDHFTWKTDDVEFLKRADEPVFPVDSVLVLGSDFGTKSFSDCWAKKYRGQEYYGATERGLERLFAEVCRSTDIKDHDVFLMNAWPCLRRDGNAHRGTPPGALHTEFTEGCQQFFKAALTEMHPRLILPLGVWPTAFVASCIPGCPSAWSVPGTGVRKSTWRKVDEEPYKLIDGMAIVPIPHPSMPNLPPSMKGMKREQAVEAQTARIREALSSAKRRHGRSGPIDSEIVLARLREGLSRIGPYPEHCCVCPRVFHASNFFPAGDGLWSLRNSGLRVRRPIC